MTIVAIVNYWLLIPSVIIIIGLVTLRQIFVNTSRDVKRLESICKFLLLTFVLRFFNNIYSRCLLSITLQPAVLFIP